MVLVVWSYFTNIHTPLVSSPHHPHSSHQKVPHHPQDPRLLQHWHGHHQVSPQPLLPRRLVRPLPAQQELQHILLQIPPQTHGHSSYFTGKINFSENWLRIVSSGQVSIFFDIKIWSTQERWWQTQQKIINDKDKRCKSKRWSGSFIEVSYKHRWEQIENIFCKNDIIKIFLLSSSRW